MPDSQVDLVDCCDMSDICQLINCCNCFDCCDNDASLLLQSPVSGRNVQTCCVLNTKQVDYLTVNDSVHIQTVFGSWTLANNNTYPWIYSRNLRDRERDFRVTYWTFIVDLHVCKVHYTYGVPHQASEIIFAGILNLRKLQLVFGYFCCLWLSFSCRILKERPWSQGYCFELQTHICWPCVCAVCCSILQCANWPQGQVAGGTWKINLQSHEKCLLDYGV